MSDATLAPGLLTLICTGATTNINVHNQIPMQLMKLINVRVQMSSAANAVTAQIAYIDLPFLSSQQLIDGISDRFMLPIPLSETRVTQYTCDIPIYMSKRVHNNITMNVYDATGAALANVDSVILQFSYQYGHMS